MRIVKSCGLFIIAAIYIILPYSLKGEVLYMNRVNEQTPSYDSTGIISEPIIDSVLAKSTVVYKFDMKSDVGPALWRQTQKSFAEAEELNADFILIHMNTYGGLVQAADSIRTKILNTKIPVIVFVDNNAISAGALIAIAAQQIYMRPGASIGAATVVDATGSEVPDKYQSFMRAAMRSTAESHGRDTIISGSDTLLIWHRDPAIAEAMVDPSTFIEGIIAEGKVLTLTSDEALKVGYCEGLASNIPELLELAGIENYQIIEYYLTPLEKLIGFLINPVFQGLLIMVIIGGLYFELQSPGVGFPLGAAVLAAILYFAPLYLEGIAQNWEIALFILGIILLAIEIFVIPGFGIAGISGIVLMITGLSLAMVDNIVWEFEGAGVEPVVKSLVLVVTSSFIAILVSIATSRKLLDTGPFAKLILNSTQKREDGYSSFDTVYDSMKGRTGIAATSLRPSGRIDIEGEIYDAKSLTGYIEKGEPIKIIKFETGQLYVVKIN